MPTWTGFCAACPLFSWDCHWYEMPLNTPMSGRPILTKSTPEPLAGHSPLRVAGLLLVPPRNFQMALLLLSLSHGLRSHLLAAAILTFESFNLVGLRLYPCPMGIHQEFPGGVLVMVDFASNLCHPSVLFAALLWVEGFFTSGSSLSHNAHSDLTIKGLREVASRDLESNACLLKCFY